MRGSLWFWTLTVQECVPLQPGLLYIQLVTFIEDINISHKILGASEFNFLWTGLSEVGGSNKP